MPAATIDVNIGLNTKLDENITVSIGDASIIVPRERLVRALLGDILGRAPTTTDGLHAPSLNDGEHYAGILLGKDGAPNHHLILLPGDHDDLPWQAAMDWAKSVGGELPTRREQSLLYANLPEQFKSEYYWSGNQPASTSNYAWVQDFVYGNQHYFYKGTSYRARAVRRSVI